MITLSNPDFPKPRVAAESQHFAIHARPVVSNLVAAGVVVDPCAHLCRNGNGNFGSTATARRGKGMSKLLYCMA